MVSWVGSSARLFVCMLVTIVSHTLLPLCQIPGASGQATPPQRLGSKTCAGAQCRLPVADPVGPCRLPPPLTPQPARPAHESAPQVQESGLRDEKSVASCARHTDAGRQLLNTGPALRGRTPDAYTPRTKTRVQTPLQEARERRRSRLRKGSLTDRVPADLWECMDSSEFLGITQHPGKQD